MHKAGEIVLVPFPFTDLSGNKVRPALILAVQKSSNDLTVCFISSVSNKKVSNFNVTIDHKDASFKRTGLKMKSIIRVTKIATLDKIVVLGKIGVLDTKNLVKVKDILKIYFKF